MRSAWVMWICFVMCGLNIHAQDPHFSQFYANPLYLSPSLAGSTDGGRVILNYRNQWPAIGNIFETYAVSADKFFNEFNSGLGFYLIQDVAGSGGLITQNMAFQYSYNIVISEDWQIIPALQFSYGRKSIDFSKLDFGDKLYYGNSGGSGAFSKFVTDKSSYIDFASSVMVYSSKYWNGLTVDHLLQPNHTFLNEEMRLPIKATFFGGVNIWSRQSRKEGLERSFALSYRFQLQERFKQLDFGFYWFNNPIEVGIWLRGLPGSSKTYSTRNKEGEVDFGGSTEVFDRDAIVVLAAYEYGPFRFGYSYDITISELGWQTAGAHELSVIYEFGQSLSARLGRKRPAVPCSKTANPLSSSSKYKRKSRRIY